MLFQTAFHRVFYFSHKRLTFALTPESGYTLGLRRKIAHNGLHAETGAFLPSATAWLCAASEIHFIPPCFYIHTFPGSLWTTISNSSISDHLSSRFSTSRTNSPRSLSQAKVGTHSAFGERSHTRAFPSVGTAWRCVASEIATERTAGGSGCTPVACVRFLRRRGPAGLRSHAAVVRSVCLAGLKRLDQAFRQSYYHTQRPSGQPFGACVGAALGGKMRAITLDFKESHHGRT